MRCNPIAVIRITENIDHWEDQHHNPCPPGLIIAWARTQGLEPDPEQVQLLLNTRKEWRGHKALPEPGEGFNLDISIAPPDTGDTDPAGGSYPPNTEVQLTAIPNEGYTFHRWTGGASGTANPIIITMDSDKNITAHFKHI